MTNRNIRSLLKLDLNRIVLTDLMWMTLGIVNISLCMIRKWRDISKFAMPRIHDSFTVALKLIWNLKTRFKKNPFNRGGSRIPRRRGRQPSRRGAPAYKFVRFSKKLHEIKKILVRRGVAPPLIPPLVSLHNSDKSYVSANIVDIFLCVTIMLS